MCSRIEKLVEPQERLKILSNSCNTLEVDPHIRPMMYYRSGRELVRMANVYYKEGNLENAYVLYMKYMTLFIEKIRGHPDFATVPITVKQINKQELRDIIPKAEKIKQELLKQYAKEYNLYLTIKAKEDEEERKAKQEREAHDRSSKSSTKYVSDPATWVTTTVTMPSTNIDSIHYPDPNVSTVDTYIKPVKPVIPDKPTPDTVPSMPTFDRGKKPSVTQTSVGALRTVVIPSTLMPRFLLLAGKNTLANKETCGILAGKLEQNQLIITHLIIPKQKGTSDSCLTMNEEEIFDYQDQHSLITFGWIHTHPTQTAFLSSVDLHTHCPYQLLMPEAIAIVCAPKYNDTGIFVLTPNYGLQYILNCRQTGFHPHPTDPPLFATAHHIKMDGNAPLEILDLRDK